MSLNTPSRMVLPLAGLFILLLVVTVNAATIPAITLTTPNGGQTWNRGTSQTITWDYTGSPGSTVKIVLVKGGTEVGTIKDSTSIGSNGKGSYTWPMSLYGSTGSDFKVSVQSISQPTIKDLSNNYFTITPPGTSASTITVTSPNGGRPGTEALRKQLPGIIRAVPGRR